MLAQPGIGSVFLLSQFLRLLQNCFCGLKLTAISRQSLRKFLGEISLQSEALDAALLQQTATSTALRCPSDLSAIHHHVGANGIRETIVAAGVDGGSRSSGKAAGVKAPGYNCSLPRVNQRPAPSATTFFVTSA